MPRRKINVKQRILGILDKYGELTWTGLLEKTNVSKGALSKYMNKPQMKDMIERNVDATTKPPTVYYRLKEIGMADVPEKLASDVFDYTARSKFIEQVKKEVEVLRKKGIVAIKGPGNAVENMYDFWFQDFLFTLYRGSQAPNIWLALNLLNWHVMTYKLTMWKMMIKFAQDPEWKEELEKGWKVYLENLEEP